MKEHRAIFDAEITFANGGGLQTQGFRLDIVDDSISDENLGALLIRHLGLLMVDSVKISNKTIVVEPHTGSRGARRARPRSGELIELSHPIRHGMTTCPGLPGPEISEYLSREDSRSRYAPGTEFHIARISMIANTGTYVDTPAHRYAAGADLSAVGLSSLVNLPGVVVRVPDGVAAIDRRLLAPYHVDGRAVLLHTAWDRYWGSDAYGRGGHPFLTLDGAAHLAESGATLVGIDSVNVDDTSDSSRPAHTTLLGQGIPIAEHLCGLDRLPPDGFHFHAAPPLLEGVGTFPVRAFAIIGAD